MKDSAAVSIFPGMASMYWSDWSLGQPNRFYSILCVCLAGGGGEEGEKEEEGKWRGGGREGYIEAIPGKIDTAAIH